MGHFIVGVPRTFVKIYPWVIRGLTLIFILMLIVNLTVSVDLIASVIGVTKIDFKSIKDTSELTYDSPSNSVFFELNLDVPKLGIFAKQLNSTFQFSYYDGNNDVHIQRIQTIKTGETNIISSSFPLSFENRIAILSGGFVTITLTLLVTIIYAGNALTGLSRIVQIGAFDVS